MNILRGTIKRAYLWLSRSRRLRGFVSKLATVPGFAEWADSHPCKELAGDCFPARMELWAYVLDTCNLRGPINYLEFGVHKGESMRWWVKENVDPDSRFVGFDSFHGLPETWHGFNKEYFSTKGKVPEINDQRCAFQVGWFQETLPGFVREFRSEKPLVVHLDADLYSSTLYALCLLQPFLKRGDVIIFDEFCDREHEFRAFSDFVGAFGLEYVPLARTSHFTQFALRIA